MANTNTDLTEEDAADLQFPKVSEQKAAAKNVVLGYCSHCYRELLVRYILCAECDSRVCLGCFAAGAEFGSHKNDHSYRVLGSDFLLFEHSDWTAEEELRLLESLHFYGNWNLTALDFSNRSMQEIKEHYEYFYLDRNGHKDMPIYKRHTPIAEVSVPYRFKLADSEEPPRYAPNTVGYQSLAGYNAARGDFENEYDKNAEDLIAPLDLVERNHPHYNVLTDLQYAIMQSYNERLKERQRRKVVMARHGLLVLRKVYSWLNRFDGALTREVCEKFARFMHLCEPNKFEMLLEGLNRSGELRIRIQRRTTNVASCSTVSTPLTSPATPTDSSSRESVWDSMGTIIYREEESQITQDDNIVDETQTEPPPKKQCSTSEAESLTPTPVSSSRTTPRRLSSDQSAIIETTLLNLNKMMDTHKKADKNVTFGQYVGQCLSEMGVREQNQKKLKIMEILNEKFVEEV